MLEIKKLVVGELSTNCYLLISKETKETYIVDPGDEAGYIEDKIREFGCIPIAIILTHGHFDHLLAALELSLAYGIAVYANIKDNFLIKRADSTARHFTENPEALKPDKIEDISKLENLRLGNDNLQILPLPGHTPGSIGIYSKKYHFAITGDLIFSDKHFGETRHSYSKIDDYKKSLAIMTAFPEDTTIYPGHGEEFSVIDIKKLKLWYNLHSIMPKELKAVFKKIGGLLGKLVKVIKRLLKSKRFVTVSVIVIVLVLLFIFKSVFVAAIVNGKPIFRYSLTRQLEKLDGRTVLNNIVDQAIVYSEAQKQNKLATADQVNAMLKDIEDSIKSQGLTLDQALSIRGQTKTDLLEQIKLQKTVENILGGKITITDKEISDYFTQNKSLFNATDTLDKVKDSIKATLFQQKLSTEYQTWLTDLKAKAKVLYFVNF